MERLVEEAVVVDEVGVGSKGGNCWLGRVGWVFEACELFDRLGIDRLGVGPLELGEKFFRGANLSSNNLAIETACTKDFGISLYTQHFSLAPCSHSENTPA
jgi:hypothetical protein